MTAEDKQVAEDFITKIMKPQLKSSYKFEVNYLVVMFKICLKKGVNCAWNNLYAQEGFEQGLFGMLCFVIEYESTIKVNKRLYINPKEIVLIEQVHMWQSNEYHKNDNMPANPLKHVFYTSRHPDEYCDSKQFVPEKYDKDIKINTIKRDL